MEAQQKIHSLTGAGASVSAPVVVKRRDPVPSRRMSLAEAHIIRAAQEIDEQDAERWDGLS